MRSFACSVLLSAVLLVPLAGCADDAETIPSTTAGAAGAAGGGAGGASGKSGSSGHTTGGKSGSSGSSGSSSGASGSGDVGGSGGDGGTGGASAGTAGSTTAGSSGASAGGAGQGGAGAGGTSAGANAGGSGAGVAGTGGTTGGTDAGGTDGGAGQGGTDSAGGAGGESAGGAGGESAGGAAGTDGGGAGTSAAGQGGTAGTDAGGAAGTGGGSGSSGQGGGPGVRLRLMASNLTSGTKQSYEDPGPGIRMLMGVHPDVVMVQEFNYGANNAAAFATMTSKVLGESGYYYHETAGQIPNGIISRYPIVESGSWDDKLATDREFAWARIDIPGPHDLWAVSVHLLTKSETTRNSQAKQLVGLFAQKVPADDYLVLGGDFNTDVRTETCLTTFATQLVVGPEFPVDMAGNGNTSVKRNKPYDWVLGDSDLDKLSIPVVIGANVFAHGFVVDTKSYSPLSDLAPALATDSLDTVNGKPTYMQHLGVVRDFWIPVP